MDLHNISGLGNIEVELDFNVNITMTTYEQPSWKEVINIRWHRNIILYFLEFSKTERLD